MTKGQIITKWAESKGIKVINLPATTLTKADLRGYPILIKKVDA